MLMNSTLTFKKITLLLLLITLLSMTACSSSEPQRIISHADYKVYTTVNEAVRDADIIVVAKVKSVQAPQEWNINLDKTEPPLNVVHTLSELEVINTVKGPPPGSNITIKQSGGKYKGVIYEESGSGDFVRLGKEYLLFLNSYDDRSPGEPYTLINPTQGIIDIEGAQMSFSSESTNYLKRIATDTTDMIMELKRIDSTLPRRNTEVDQKLLDQLRNK
ncbi:hypothetical protein [Paenibacillus sp. NPDC057967]|uniref:hypothetical protein n=1 Tax=Paenibacillus sp. NPDC057967 TaxID=3346293 RepID=UPI0036DE3241